MCISYILFVDIDAKPPKGGNLGFSRIFEKSRILSFLRKSSICAMNVAYPPYERACVTLSDSRHRQALNFVDFRQILVKIRKILIFRLFSKNLVDAFASTKIEKIFASTDSQTHSGYTSWSQWSPMTPLESPNDGFISVYLQFSLKKWRC